MEPCCGHPEGSQVPSSFSRVSLLQPHEVFQTADVHVGCLFASNQGLVYETWLGKAFLIQIDIQVLQENRVLEVEDSVFRTSVIPSLRTFRPATGASGMDYLLPRLNVSLGYKTDSSVLSEIGLSLCKAL